MTTEPHDFDILLARSAADEIDIDPALAVRLHEMSLTLADQLRQEKAGRPLWKQRRFIAFSFGVLVLGTTAGMVMPQLNLSGWTSDGVQIEADAIIPIHYQTTSGKTVACSFALAFLPQDNHEDVSELSSFVRNHDWTGIGQKIYDEAIRNPFIPGPNDQGFDNAEQWTLDSRSFMTAQTNLIYAEIPRELMPDGTASAGTSNCLDSLDLR